MIIDYKTIASVSALLLTVFFLTITLLTIDFGSAYGQNVVIYLIRYYLFLSVLNTSVFGLTIIFGVINYFVSFVLLIISIIMLGISLYIIFHAAIVFGRINSEVENIRNAKMDKKQE